MSLRRTIFHATCYLSLLFCSAVTSCMTPEEWMARNPPVEDNGGKDEPVPEKVFVQEYEVREKAQPFDTIILHVSSPAYISDVTIPQVKYNLRTPVCIISDDMSQNDLTTAWLLFNGYSAGNAWNSYCNDFIRCLTGSAVTGYIRPIHEPWTYPTDDGKERRWSMTSAVWPNDAERVNYTRINATDAKGMMRMGHSFAQHDITSQQTSGADLDDIAQMFVEESERWRSITGVGLKVMVEPSGDKTYVVAAQRSRQICMSVCQAAGSGWLHHDGGSTVYSRNQVDEGDEHITFGSLPTEVEAWAEGDILPDYGNKTLQSLVRGFINGGTWAHQIPEEVEARPGRINAYGMHGVDSLTVESLEKLRALPGLWVTSIDELWEYYYLRKHTRIETRPEAGGTQVRIIMPQYADHQFRDLTINLEATDVESITFSANTVTGGWRQNDGYCTVNLGLETRMYKYITELMNIAYRYPGNSCIRRDLNYLTDLLAEGKRKEQYKALLAKLYPSD